MSNGKDSGIFFLLIVLAGLASVAVSAFGVFAGAWGGFVGTPGQPFSFEHLIFWLFPALCFPAFCFTLVSKRIGLVCLWMIPVGTAIVLFSINWRSCMEGRCTTTNPILIALGTFVALGPFSPVIWIAPICMQFVRKRG